MVDKPEALDLYCGAGGCTRGLQRAGFRVTGIDAKHQPRYIGDSFIQKNVLDVQPEYIRHFDFVIASPPCQRYVPMANNGNHPDLIDRTRNLLQQADVPFVIENVMSAPIPRWIVLCGTMFPSLRVIRHRKFETHGFKLQQLYHINRWEHPPVYSFDRRERRLQGLDPDDEDTYITVAGNNASLAAMSNAMGIHWMTRPEIAQAIPPVYTTYIGRQFLENDRP
jgi:DNA (cytosine-5)-methyltransferase 1